MQDLKHTIQQFLRNIKNCDKRVSVPKTILYKVGTSFILLLYKI